MAVRCGTLWQAESTSQVGDMAAVVQCHQRSETLPTPSPEPLLFSGSLEHLQPKGAWRFSRDPEPETGLWDVWKKPRAFWVVRGGEQIIPG